MGGLQSTQRLLSLNKYQAWVRQSINFDCELNEDNLKFLTKLHLKSSEGFHRLILRFKTLSEANLSLNEHHINILITAIEQLMMLPSEALESVGHFLKENPIDYRATIATLRKVHGPELDNAAQKTLKLHHASPHALEIRVRTMLVLSHLGVFSADNECNEFLKTIISFMIEFHDQEQIDPGPFKSVEEATADRLLTWLDSTLGLKKNSTLRALLAFIANRVIVLGTTMVFSPTQTMDLSELYFFLEDIVMQSGLLVLSPSNEILCRSVNTVMLVAGVCDKNPAAIPLLVKSQQTDNAVCTLDLLKIYKKDSSLWEFFSSGTFKPYYDNKRFSLHLADLQAFFITLAPHISMRTELVAKSKPRLANVLISFIVESRAMRVALPREEFIRWYDRQFSKLSLNTVVDELFFTALRKEALFCRSQIGGLKFVAERLMLIQKKDITLIDCGVPERDALNLFALETFYLKLDKYKQSELISELLMAVVVQAGAIYGYQSGRGYYHAVNSEKDRNAAASCRLFVSGVLIPVDENDKLEKIPDACSSAMF